LSRRENKKICSFFTDSETKVSNHSYQEEEEDDDEEEEEEEESFEDRCGDRDGEERHDERTQTRIGAVSLAAAHPHLWMQEFIQRVFLDGRNNPKVICRCRKSSKVVSGWRKAWKGYL
jgi:hypothetical protein